MSKVCCDLCAYWLPQFKECGNIHINKCVNKEHFVKVERNCGTCEREIRIEVIDEFIEKMEEWNDKVKSIRNENAFFTIENIHKVAQQMKEGINNE